MKIYRFESAFKARGCLSMAALWLLCLALPAYAAEDEKRNFVSLSVENDSIGGGTDKFYTSGVRLSWFNAGTDVPDMVDDVAEMMPGFRLNDSTSTMFSVGQNLFTPDKIDVVGPQDDRPWAAWLYGSVGLATTVDNHVDEFELTLGVVGPEAFGEQSQKFIHSHITNSPTPRGWRNQLKFEPGVIVSWQRRWPEFMTADVGDYFLRAAPNINTSLGNIYTYAGAGMTFTFGPYQARLQDTPPRARPAMPGTGYFRTPDQDWSWFLFAGLDGRAVGRNIFLDGNSFRDSPSVNKKPFVGDASLGFALTFDDVRLSYSYNVRSPEFNGQGVESSFGALGLTLRF